MKKSFFLAALFAALICVVPALHAQSAENSNTGNFEMMNSNGETVQVRYSTAPAYPNNLALQFSASTSFVLNSHIIDSKGTEVVKIKQENVTGRYANSIDISALAPGNYFVEIMRGNEQEPYRIAFSK